MQSKKPGSASATWVVPSALAKHWRPASILAPSTRSATAASLSNSPGGLYRLTDLPDLSEPDLATVAKRIPEGVVCLISSLAVHELTTQIPHAVHLALERGTRYPKLDHPPLRVYLFSKSAFLAGIDEREVDGVQLRVYSAEKTLADGFKFRHNIGQDVATEALRAYRRRPGANLQQVYEYARICRVANVIRPYLEAGL